MVLAPLVRGKKGEHKEIIDEAKREGFVRLRIDGEVLEIGYEIELDKKKKHSIEAVVDRLVVKQTSKRRLADSVETALKMGQGTVLINIKNQDLLYSEQFACLNCNISYEEPTPRLFSFNSPFGACKVCDGLGQKMEIDSDLVIPDHTQSISSRRDSSVGRCRDVELVSVYAQRGGRIISISNSQRRSISFRKKSSR